jgi:hypothetical protein
MQNPLDPSVAGAIVGAIFGACCCWPLVIIALKALCCWFFARALKRVPEQHRRMSPRAAYLWLIPFFDLVWAFMIATRVPASVRAGLDAAGDREGGDCGKGVGVAWAIASGVSGLLGIPLVAPIVLHLARGEHQRAAELAQGGGSLQTTANALTFGAVVLVIIFIVQISKASRRLIAPTV